MDKLVNYFKLSQLCDDNRVAEFRDNKQRNIIAFLDKKDDKEVVKILARGRNRLIELEGEELWQVQVELLNILKESIVEKKKVILFAKKLFKNDLIDNLAIAKDGTISNIDLIGKEFSDEIKHFFKRPEFRFMYVVNSVFNLSCKKYDKLKAINAFSALQDSQYHMTEMNAENVEEYFQYLISLHIACEDDLEFIRNNHQDLLEDRNFFDLFLLDVHSAKVKLEYHFDVEDHLAEQVPLDFIALKEADQPLLQMKFPDNAERFSGDQVGIHNVGNSEIHYAETIGCALSRPEQEDAFIIGEGNNVDVLEIAQNFDEIGVKIKEEQEKLYAANHHKKDYVVGSTAIFANYSTDQSLSIANCGDSRASLFIIDNAKKEVMQAMPLTSDHRPGKLFEKRRIYDLGGEIVNNRVTVRSTNAIHQLSVSRSFGDPFYRGKKNDYLISSNSDIYEYDVKKLLSEITKKYGIDAKIILMISCDGLYEATDQLVLSEKLYARAFNRWFKNADNMQEKWQGNIAEYIQDCALDFGSRDNITVCITDISNVPDKDVAIGVFDGHGGKLVSQTLAAKCSRTLTKQDDLLISFDTAKERMLLPELSTNSSDIDLKEEQKDPRKRERENKDEEEKEPPKSSLKRAKTMKLHSPERAQQGDRK